MPQKWKDATISVLFKKGDRQECGNYRGISLTSHHGKAILLIIMARLGVFAENTGILPEEQCGFRPHRSTRDMLFVVRLLQEFGREKDVPLFVCFINLKKVYDSVDRPLLWLILGRFGVPASLISIIRAFHDGMRACVRIGSDGVCSDWFHITRGLRQGCVLAPLLFNLFFAAVFEVVIKCIMSSDADVVADLVLVRYRFDVDPLCQGAATKRKANAALQRVLWSMLYADDAGIVSRTVSSLETMMHIIVTTSAEFGLTVSESKTETMCLRIRDSRNAPAPVPVVQISAAGQKYRQKAHFTYLGSLITENAEIAAEEASRL